MPRIFIISGPNGSGKTTASYTLLPDMLNCREFVNSDEFAKSLSPFDPSNAAVNASRKMMEKVNYLLGRKKDFCIETTLATRSLLGLINKAHEAGYQIALIYFWVDSPEIALKRVKMRVDKGGHNIEEETIRRRYKMGLRYFFNTYAQICDHWVLADNTNPPFKVIAERNRSITDILGDLPSIKDPEKYTAILNSLNDTR